MWHRIDNSAYMRMVAEDWLTARWWVVALPLALCLAAGMWIDARFYAAMPALVCLVGIPVMALLYYYYCLTPEAQASVRPHRAVADTHNTGLITVEFKPDSDTGREFAPYVIRVADVASAEPRGDNVVIRLRSLPFRPVILERSAVPDTMLNP